MGRAAKVSSAWHRFWFEPQSTATVALVRIGFGLLAFLWAVSLAPDLLDFFSEDGILAAQPEQGPGVWGLLGVFEGDAAVLAVYLGLLLGSVALVFGCFTRLAALLVFVALLSFARRNPFILNSGDGLVRVIGLMVLLMPAGAALSIDRLRRTKAEFWDFPMRAPWALRLMQIQLSVIYLSTVWQKVRGVSWNDGTAVSYALRIADLERFPVPGLLSESVTLTNLATFGTLATEFSLGVLVWNRKLRPWVLSIGVAMHLSIDYSLRVGFFSYAMFVLYLAFVPPETARHLILSMRDRIAAIRRPRARTPQAAGVLNRSVRRSSD